MNWSALKNNKCPKCGKDLALANAVSTTGGPGIKHECGFVISNRKFSAIVTDRFNRNIPGQDEAEVIEQDFLP